MVLPQGWFLCLSCALYKDHPSDFIPVSVKNTPTRDLLVETSSKSLAPSVSLVLLHCVTLFFPTSHYVTHFYSNKNENTYNTCINIVYVNIFCKAYMIFNNSYIHIKCIYIHGVPCSSNSKESACYAGDQGSIPGSGRSSGEGNGNPLQCSCLGNPMDRGAWWATVCGVTELDRTEQLTHTYTHIIYNIYICIHAVNTPGQREGNTESLLSFPPKLTHQLNVWAVCCWESQ